MVKVFYSDITGLDLNVNIDEFCCERINYVNSITDSLRKKQSIYVWKLLLKAFNLLDIPCKGFKNNNGRWELIDSKYKFSLSHSNNLVVVGISDVDVGVDVEMYSPKLLRVAKKYFPAQQLPKNKTEFSFYGQLWTKHECAVKNSDKNGLFSTYTVRDNFDNKYIIGVISNQRISLEKINLG